jgi:broad specificity phosphatase PhoE
MNRPSAQQPSLSSRPATALWLIRHAEVEARYQSVFAGRIDMELSERGRQQAAMLAGYLHQQRFDALYASPMNRVRQTLAPFLLNGAPKPIIMSDLREVDFGDWTGFTWEQVESRFGISPYAWLEQLERGGIDNAECAAAFRARLEPCLRQILAKHSGQQIAIACHGGVIRMLLAILLDWPFSKLAAFEIEYASVTQVIWVGSRPRLQLVNFTPWRDFVKRFCAG